MSWNPRRPTAANGTPRQITSAESHAVYGNVNLSDNAAAGDFFNLETNIYANTQHVANERVYENFTR